MAKKSNPYGTGLFYKRTKKKRQGRNRKQLKNRGQGK